MKKILFFLLLLNAFACKQKTKAQPQVPVISFQQLISGLSSPVDIVNAGDGSGRIFIVEQTGTIRIYQTGVLLPQPFLNVTPFIVSGGERGLLSLAFHPDYANNRYFFIYYNNPAGDITVAQYRTDAANPNHCDSTTGKVLLSIPKPFSNHNGGKLIFGKDGNLYFGTGDGGSGGDPNNYSQNGNSLLGKMLRLNVDNFTIAPYYTIPLTNPYTSDPAVRDEIWTLGLRNPWRWSFDRQNGDMWIADVGQGAWEEINYRASGSTGGINYGWRCYEGNHAYNTAGCQPQSSYISLIFEYPHNNATGGFSVTGGYVYRGAEFNFLQGYYLCADYVSGNGWLIKSNGSGGWETTQQTWIGSITSFGEAEDATLYAVTLSGVFYKVNALNPIPLTLIFFNGKNNNGQAMLHWVTENEHMTKQFEVEQSSDGQTFTRIGIVTAKNTPVTNAYDFTYSPATTFYRLKMVDVNGSFKYSAVIKLSDNKIQPQQIYPNSITNGQLHIYPAGDLKAVDIFDAAGKKLQSNRYNNAGTVHIIINVSTLPKGMYWVKIDNDGAENTEKIVVE